MAKNISTLAVDLTANTAKFQKELTAASRRTKSFGSELKAMSKYAVGALAAVGAASTAGLAVLSSEMDNAGKQASKLGLTTEALTSLRYAVEQTSDMAGTQFDVAMQRMTRRLSEAAQGTGEARNALAELGLDAQKLNAMSPDQAFKAIADQMSQVGSQSDRVRLAFKLFDTEGVGLVNTMQDGSEAIEALQKEAVDLGVAFSDVAANNAAELNDQLDKLAAAYKGAMISLANDSGAIETAGQFLRDLNYAMDQTREKNTGLANSFDGVSSFVKHVIANVNNLGAAYDALQYKIGLVYAVLNTEVSLSTFEEIERLVESYNEKIDELYSSAAKFNAALFAGNQSQATGGSSPSLLPSVNIGATAPAKPKTVKGEDWRSMLDSQTSDFGEDPFSTQSATGDWGSMLDEQTGLFAADIAASQNQIQTLESLYAEGLDRERMFRDERLVMVQDALDREAVSVERAAQLKNQIEQDYQDAQLSTASEGFGMIANLMNTNSKEMFEIGKKAAIVQTTIDTYQMATSSYKAMAGIPFIGPALGAAAAASAVAFGLAQVSSISSQQFTPSAEGGFDIPAGVNPVTQLHEKEMVLPKAQAEVIRNLANGGGSGVEVHIHNAPGGADVKQDGNRIDITFIKEAVSGMMAKDVVAGTSPMNTALEQAYQVHR